MKDQKWKKIKTDRVFDHKFFKVNRDIVRLPDGREVEWLYWDSRDSTMIVPVTPDGKLVMIRQYRYLPNQIAVEFPSGRSNVGESMEDCARRELKEETGYVCSEIIKLGEFHETMSQLTRKIHIYIAMGAKTTVKDQRIFHSAVLDEYEQTEVILRDLDEVVREVMAGKVISMGSSLAVLLAKEYLKKEKNAGAS